MPEDAAFPLHFDESGDVATVSGFEFYQHHALQLGLLAAEDIRGRAMNATNITSLESDVARSIRSSPYFDEPVNATVVEVTNEGYTIEVDANNLSTFDIEV